MLVACVVIIIILLLYCTPNYYELAVASAVGAKMIYDKKMRALRSLPVRKLEDITLQTGDLLFMRYDYFGTLNILKFIVTNVLYTLVRNVFTHCCLIIVIDGVPYVYTSINEVRYDLATKTYKKGSMLLPISYLITYNGYVVVKQTTTKFNQKELEKYIFTRSFEFNGDLFNMIIAATVDPEYASTKLFCGQIVRNALKKLGIHTRSVDPNDIYGLANNYSKPFLLENKFLEYNVSNL